MMSEYGVKYRCHNCQNTFLGQDVKPVNPNLPPIKGNNNPIEPNHYTDLKISPLEYITANEGEFTWCIANVIKYVSRYKRKNGLEDLKKAQYYLNKQIEILENKEDGNSKRD